MAYGVLISNTSGQSIVDTRTDKLNVVVSSAAESCLQARGYERLNTTTAQCNNLIGLVVNIGAVKPKWRQVCQVSCHFNCSNGHSIQITHFYAY